MNIIKNVPHDWTFDDVFKNLSIPEGMDDDELDEIKDLVKEAESVAAPKILYAVSTITDRDENGVWLDGKRIDSALAAENLKNTDKAYPYVCTCGREIYGWAKEISDPLFSFYADKLMLYYVSRAFTYLTKLLKSEYICEGHASHMNPGSLPQWPLSQQKNLFSVLGDVYNAVGVELTESFLMVPEKSMSGFYFEGAKAFNNCAVCTMYHCPSNRNKNK